VDVPRKIQPLRDIEQTHREPRDNESAPPSNQQHDELNYPFLSAIPILRYPDTEIMYHTLMR